MGPVKDITGRRFARLVALERDGMTNNGQVRWRCLCDCGTGVTVAGGDLRSGHTRSCGCLAKEVQSTRVQTHKTHGMTKTRIYRVWRAMIVRCTDPKDIGYRLYGARGVTVCPEWMADFQRFYDDFGHSRPTPDHTIDRIDGTAGYRPGNVRWATSTEQNNNKRTNVHITHEGRTQTIAQWAREVGLDRTTLGKRIQNGLPPAQALYQPSRKARSN